MPLNALSEELAPVAFFVFNRPGLTQQVFDRIRAARPQKLLVIADGPRADRPGEAELCREVRSIVSHPDWPCELITNFSDRNLGCRNRISSGIDWVFEQCAEAIILEDDCIPGASFFPFVSAMLRRYRDDSRVVHVSGDNFQDGHARGDASYFFSQYPLSWGWGTWRRAWKNYDVNMADWPSALKEGWLKRVFRNSEERRYWSIIFTRQYAGLIDTWDYQWLYTCWRSGGLSIQPNSNLVTNIGAGADATHFRDDHSTIGLPIRELEDLRFTDVVEASDTADRYTFRHHITSKSVLGESWFGKFRKALSLRTRMRRLLDAGENAAGHQSSIL